MDSFPAPAFSKKTFGETRADTVESVFLHRPGGSGVSDPRLQKIRIQNHCAGGQAATVAGVPGPGLHTWPSGHIPQDTDTKPFFRIRSSAKKTFGETFGAATGVSDPRLQKIRIRNNGAGGQAAAVAGHVGPGFHTWPLGHINQDTDTKPLLRIRSSAKRRSERRSAPRPGSATHGYRNSGYEPIYAAAKPPL